MLIHVESAVLATLHETAADQGGLFVLAQAQALGIEAEQLKRWTEKGWVRRVRRGVYAFAGTPPSRWHPAVSAALAAGAGAVLSHQTAAVIHGFPGVLLDDIPDVTVPEGFRRRLTGVRVHLTGPVPTAEQVVRRGVAVTSPVRTVVDMAAETSAVLLGSILDEGAVRRQWCFEEVAASLDRQVHRREGANKLRKLLAVRVGEATPDSRLEQRLIRYLAPLGPFEVHYQMVLDGVVIVVDVAWPWCQVAAEIDGRSFRTHSRSAHDRESRKLTLLTAAEWKVAHLTASMGPAECRAAVLSLMPDPFNHRRFAHGARGVRPGQ